ncbi:MAG: hypothetical protein FWF94_06885 [Oscillospiraceae bacterium]|nr:hypothetical protein [Oscillospiraceae bacterium]
MAKNKTKVEYLKTKTQFKLKGGEFSKIAAILFPLLGLAVLVLGGYILINNLSEAGKVPDDEYKFAEKLIEDNSLIGLSFDECSQITNAATFYSNQTPSTEESKEWIFPAGSKAYAAGNGQIFYNIRVKHKNGKAVGAVLKKMKMKESD